MRAGPLSMPPQLLLATGREWQILVQPGQLLIARYYPSGDHTPFLRKQDSNCLLLKETVDM